MWAFVVQRVAASMQVAEALLSRSWPGAGPVASAALTAVAVVIVPLLVLKSVHDLLAFLAHARQWARLPPVTSGFWEPFTGNALEMVKGIYGFNTLGPWDVLARWTRESKAALFRFRVAQRLCIGTAHWEALKRIYQTRFPIYQKDLEWSFQEFIGILGTGIVTSHGDAWRQQRKFMTPVLKDHILNIVPRVSQAAFERLAAKLDAHCGGEVEIEEEYRLVTLQVIGEILLSLPPDECDRVFPEVYLPVMAESNRRVLAPWRRYLFFLPEFWRYSSRLRFLDLYLKRIIAARWAAMEAAGPAPAAGEANGNGGVPGVSAGSAGAQDGDFLTQLIAEMRSRGMGWSKETEEQLCYEMKTLLLAGHETSAAMLTFATHEVFSAPNALRRVREEADACLPPPGQVPERGQVDRMECTHAVLKETLRKWSVVPVITRWVAEDDVIAGQAVPKGTFVLISLLGVHHNYWKDSERFDQNRFLPGGEYDQFPDEMRPFMFVPFSAGPRNCLGQYLSLMEARIVLGRLVQRYHLTPVYKEVVRSRLVIPVATDGGLHFKVERRDEGKQ